MSAPLPLTRIYLKLHLGRPCGGADPAPVLTYAL